MSEGKPAHDGRDFELKAPGFSTFFTILPHTESPKGEAKNRWNGSVCAQDVTVMYQRSKADDSKFEITVSVF